jgi:hypothetical protein
MHPVTVFGFFDVPLDGPVAGDRFERDVLFPGVAERTERSEVSVSLLQVKNKENDG